MPSEQEQKQSSKPIQAVKIVLTRPAVEALLGAQPEVLVGLTQQVAKAHFSKAVANSPEISKIQNILEGHVKAEISERVGKIDWGYHGAVRSVSFNPEVSKRLRDLAETIVTNEILKASMAAEEKLEKRVREILDARLDGMINNLIRDKLNRVANELKL